ncbi:MAG: thioredoxin fold domain-containing protein [Epsilonproteobacteria bacterium]|jgi:thioredoxin-related protein|nr:thioredoxin fold domain-containing protein [Campylobacterota bacterium]
MKRVLSILTIFVYLNGGTSNSNADIEAFNSAIKEKSKAKLEEKFYTIFRDGAKIAPDKIGELIVIGQPNDPYTQKLKKDIVENSDLKDALKNSHLALYYIDGTKNRLHKFYHNGALMDVDTRTLVNIYGIDATPTLIFADENGSTILMVPGYMPPKQFITTINFIKEGVFRGKDRKNGEVYQALKEYYIKHGIKIKGKSK